MSKGQLNVTIIGAGVFGGYHLQKAIESPHVDTVSIFDMDVARSTRLAREKNVPLHASLDTALTESDAVIIATPAKHHAQMALQAIEAGCHCLIEKPLAHDEALAQRICKLAISKKRLIHVGHQERYVLKAIGLDRITERPKIIECIRENKPNNRISDVSAVLDLTIHDIDMALWLMGQTPLGAMATGRSTLTDMIDHIKGELIFETSKARLTTSRNATAQCRKLILTYGSGGEIEVDFTSRQIRNTTSHIIQMNGLDTDMAKDPLAASDNAFYQAIIDSKAKAEISGEEGLLALEWALEIERLAQSSSL